MLILEELGENVLATGHKGHPGREAMVRQLRKSVWRPGIKQEVKQSVESCFGCLAAVGMNTVPPMKE